MARVRGAGVRLAGVTGGVNGAPCVTLVDEVLIGDAGVNDVLGLRAAAATVEEAVSTVAEADISAHMAHQVQAPRHC